MLARKGDDAADALEALLTLKSEGKRLLRLDVVNGGAKTPLDVAQCCQERYQDVSYRQVLSLFYQTIQHQVLELMSSEEEGLGEAGSAAANLDELAMRNNF